MLYRSHGCTVCLTCPSLPMASAASRMTLNHWLRRYRRCCDTLARANGSAGVPSFHIVPSGIVAAHCRDTHVAWLAAPSLLGKPHGPSNVRKFTDAHDHYLGKWELLAL